MGKRQQALGRYQEAAAALGHEIALEQNNPDYLNDRGVVLMENGAAKEALRDFAAALLAFDQGTALDSSLEQIMFRWNHLNV